MALTAPSTVIGAYSATGSAWQDGPGRVYDELARVLVARCPGGVGRRWVLDLGAGTGAASRAAVAAGAASVTAIDLAMGMLRSRADERPPAALGDAVALPFADGAFGAVVAAFSLNHLVDPAAGLREAARVLAPGGGAVASAYAADDDHPVKAAVEEACAALGWAPGAWYASFRRDVTPRLATVDRAVAAAEEAGLGGALVEHVRVPFPHLAPVDLVAWRLGMAQTAPFVEGLDPHRLDGLVSDALERLGSDVPVLVRSFLTISWSATT